MVSQFATWDTATPDLIPLQTTELTINNKLGTPLQIKRHISIEHISTANQFPNQRSMPAIYQFDPLETVFDHQVFDFFQIILTNKNINIFHGAKRVLFVYKIRQGDPF